MIFPEAHEGVFPHPRFVSFDFAEIGTTAPSDAELTALDHPDLFADAQKLAASVGALIVLEAAGVINDCEPKDA